MGRECTFKKYQPRRKLMLRQLGANFVDIGGIEVDLSEKIAHLKNIIREGSSYFDN